MYKGKPTGKTKGNQGKQANWKGNQENQEKQIIVVTMSAGSNTRARSNRVTVSRDLHFSLRRESSFVSIMLPMRREREG